MAERESIRDRIRRVQPDPKVRAACDVIEKVIVQSVGGEMVLLTEDMTAEEQEMAIFAGLLKEGYTAEEAERKAKEQLALFNRVFGL